LVVLLRNYVTMMHGQQNIKNGWATIVVVGRLRVKKVLYIVSSIHFTSLHITSLHFTSLHFTSLHFLHFIYFIVLFCNRNMTAILIICVQQCIRNPSTNSPFISVCRFTIFSCISAYATTRFFEFVRVLTATKKVQCVQTSYRHLNYTAILDELHLCAQNMHSS
jgi:hypothetical protein